MTDIKTVFTTAAAIIVSVGGSGAIICTIANFLSKRIANHIEDAFRHRLDKQLELYKANLENKRYITTTQFDLELDIYRELSKYFFELLIKLSTISEKEFYNNSSNSLKRMKYEKSTYDEILEIASTTQGILYKNAPFIPEHIYKKYQDVYEAINNQFWIYHERYLSYLSGKIESHERLTDYDESIYKNIEKKLFDVNTDVRSYLNTLTVL